MEKEEKKEKNIEELKKEIEELKKEKEQLFNDWQKARAELINYKKEEKLRLEEVIRFANERLIKELVAVLDSFELALNNLKNEGGESKEKYLKGIILIKSQLEEFIKREGVEEIKINKGEMPDLNFQEIVSEIETKEYPQGTIVEVFQKGYLYNGKMIRPARVAVAK
ncbi:MAG: nucleotide exchange factor GrpE [Minisyncoccia bacterium]